MAISIWHSRSSPKRGGQCQNDHNAPSSSGSVIDTWWWCPSKTFAERAAIGKSIPLTRLGLPVAIRVCQSHSLTTGMCPQRFLHRLTVETLRYILSMTHRTDFANLFSILKHGLRPTNRTLHFSCFPVGHKLHAVSSRDKCNTEIIVKQQSYLFETSECGLWACGATRNVPFPSALVGHGTSGPSSNMTWPRTMGTAP